MKKIMMSFIAVVCFLSIPFVAMANDRYKVVMIIADKNFRDEELFVTKKTLEKKKCDVVVAATTLKKATGMLGGKAKPDILVKNIKVSNYDAIILVGGSGVKIYYDNKIIAKIIKASIKQRRVLAAICLAPNILARVGALKGKAATVACGFAILKKYGALCQKGKRVVRDGLIITGNGPGASTKFAELIFKTIRENSKNSKK